MKRKAYQKPTMQVVQLENQCNILTGSNKRGRGEDFVWDEEE